MDTLCGKTTRPMQWFEIHGDWALSNVTATLAHKVYLPDNRPAASIYRLCAASVPLWYRVVAEPMTPGSTLIADTATEDLDEAIEFVWAWLGAVV